MYVLDETFVDIGAANAAFDTVADTCKSIASLPRAADAYKEAFDIVKISGDVAVVKRVS